MRGAGGNQFATSPRLFVSTMRNCGGKRPVSSTALIRRDFHPPSTALNLSPLSLSLSPLHVATLRYPKLEYHHKGIYLATIFPNERNCIDSALAPLFVLPPPLLIRQKNPYEDIPSSFLFYSPDERKGKRITKFFNSRILLIAFATTRWLHKSVSVKMLPTQLRPPPKLARVRRPIRFELFILRACTEYPSPGTCFPFVICFSMLDDKNHRRRSEEIFLFLEYWAYIFSRVD